MRRRRAADGQGGGSAGGTPVSGCEYALMPSATMTYPALAGLLRGLAPSCGPVRVVAVDGPSGAGKTTFATRLAAALNGAPVVGADDFPVPWDAADPLAWWPPLRAEVLAPLAAGRAATYRRYDWRRARYGDTVTVPVAPVLLLEGVGAARRGSPAAYRIWLDAPVALRRRRALDRDGAATAPAWDRWSLMERRHFAADLTRERADLLVDATDLPAGRFVASRGPVAD